LLEASGATVVMTRDTAHSALGNIERAELAAAAGAELTVRIHCDGNENPEVYGISMHVPAINGHQPDELILACQDAGQVILDAVIAKTGAKDRGVYKRKDLKGFNWATVPSVLIEMGFMTNNAEDEKLNSAEYQRLLAEGLRQGCIDYLTRGG
jgi:N-acetylmuramoyl-L-alanine amidase